MQRTNYIFHQNNIAELKSQLLLWAQQFNVAVWLDSNNYHQKHSNFDAVLAVDSFSHIKSSYKNSFQQLKSYQTNTKDFIFGYLSYDLKNATENLSSNNFDGLDFPDLYFFNLKNYFLLKEIL